jgi:hypothetical protein
MAELQRRQYALPNRKIQSGHTRIEYGVGLGEGRPLLPPEHEGVP